MGVSLGRIGKAPGGAVGDSPSTPSGRGGVEDIIHASTSSSRANVVGDDPNGLK
jgi:hypothetical protein